MWVFLHLKRWKTTHIHNSNLISRYVCHYIWKNVLLLSHIMFSSKYALLSRIEFCREYALFYSEFYSGKKQIFLGIYFEFSLVWFLTAKDFDLPRLKSDSYWFDSCLKGRKESTAQALCLLRLRCDELVWLFNCRLGVEIRQIMHLFYVAEINQSICKARPLRTFARAP